MAETDVLRGIDQAEDDRGATAYLSPLRQLTRNSCLAAMNKLIFSPGIMRVATW